MERCQISATQSSALKTHAESFQCSYFPSTEGYSDIRQSFHAVLLAGEKVSDYLTTLLVGKELVTVYNLLYPY